jgi:hypothetical protein
MSEKDFDWNDDLDFESLADESEMGGEYGDPGDSFSDLEDLSDYADAPEAEDSGSRSVEAKDEAAPEPPAQAVAPEPTAETTAPTRKMSARQEKVVSPAGLGFLVAVCSLVGAVGMGGALIVAAGLDPATLWNPSGFTSVDALINIQENPQNLFYLVAVGIVLLAMVGASSASRLARKANGQVHRSRELLSRVTALRLDNELAWTSEEFKSDPDTSAFVTDILGAWRLQQARHVRSAGLEGELRRLEKALREDSRQDLADRYDHPLVGTLADAMVGWYDDRDSARKETKAVKEKDELETNEIMNLIEDARSWNHSGRERVDVQAATLRRWASRFSELAERFEKETESNEAVTGLQGLRKDLARAAESSGTDHLASFDELVDRGSKLAFQIAMEVARLGPRGERLLPMSQSLEELTTQFRQNVAKAKSSGPDGVVNPESVLNRLDQIAVHLAKDGPGGAGSLVRTLQDLGPASGKLAKNLEDISDSYEQQTTRLNTLGTSFSDLSGLEFDPETVSEDEPVHPPEGGLAITQSDPFGREKEQPEASEFEVDPFGGGNDIQLPGETAESQDAGFVTDVTPGIEDNFTVDSFSSISEPEPEPVSEPALPVEEEKVYDLREFGAVRIDQTTEPVAAVEDDDRIYDLAEFGAVALN